MHRCTLQNHESLLGYPDPFVNAKTASHNQQNSYHWFFPYSPHALPIQRQDVSLQPRELCHYRIEMKCRIVFLGEMAMFEMRDVRSGIDGRIRPKQVTDRRRASKEASAEETKRCLLQPHPSSIDLVMQSA